MLKSILNLDGAQLLSKNEQKLISGGDQNYPSDCPCEPNECCSYGYCIVVDPVSERLCGLSH